MTKQYKSNYLYKSDNYLTFNAIIASNQEEYPEQFYEEIRNLNITDEEIIRIYAKNKGYVQDKSFKVLKLSMSRDEVESIRKICQCDENSNWTNLELEDGDIIRVEMPHDEVIDYLDGFTYLIYEVPTDDDDDDSVEIEKGGLKVEEAFKEKIK